MSAQLSQNLLLTVPLAPLAGAIAAGFFGRMIGRRASHMVTILGVLVAFIGYVASFFDPVQQLSQVYNTFLAGSAALDKILAVMDDEPTLVDAPDATPLPTIAGAGKFVCAVGAFVPEYADRLDESVNYLQVQLPPMNYVTPDEKVEASRRARATVFQLLQDRTGLTCEDLAKVQTVDPTVVSAKQALEMATIGAQSFLWLVTVVAIFAALSAFLPAVVAASAAVLAAGTAFSLFTWYDASRPLPSS